MCFSVTASITTGGTLMLIGIACMSIAYTSNKKWLAIAAVPFISGIQQFVEGLIWIYLNTGETDLAHTYSYLYLFFAYAFWPTYVPICVYFIESNALRKKIVKRFIWLGALTSIMIYLPILTHIVSFTTKIEENSVHYLVDLSSAIIWVYSILYAAVLILPLFISSRLRIRLYGFLILICLLVSYWWYVYALTSIWCFFSAICSAYILVLMYNLKKVQ